MSDIFNISVYHDHHDFEGDGDTVPVVGYEIELDDGKIIKVFQKDTLLCSEDYGCCLINSNTNSMIHHIVGDSIIRNVDQSDIQIQLSENPVVGVHLHRGEDPDFGLRYMVQEKKNRENYDTLVVDINFADGSVMYVCLYTVHNGHYTHRYHTELPEFNQINQS